MSDPSPKSFEDSLKELEQIAADLESGRLGLSEALQRYEQGMSYLRRCHELLANAERRVEVLTRLDEKGNVTGKPFGDESLTQKLEAEGRIGPSDDEPQADVDAVGGLF